MVFDGRYVANETAYKPYAESALASRFSDVETFDAFYESLSTREKKDEFLRVTCFYLFLVKRGDWHVDVEGSNPVIDYLTNSFKLVALFSLIESLSNVQHQDFYQWLCSRDASGLFLVQDRAALDRHYVEYNASFGSIRRCIAFFERLSESRKKELSNAVHIGGEPLSSIKHLAEFLYNLRSKFVHEARLVLQVSNHPVASVGKKGLVLADLPVGLLFDVFEEGVLAYFRDGT
ncbi:MAG: hypothetical protein ABIJ52_12325 [Pseudomonadota bacterium]